MLDFPRFQNDPIVSVRRAAEYSGDNLGFLQRKHPLRGQRLGQMVYMADSVMQPMKRPGFGMHPHVNVEVVSYVADGALTHQDSAGNTGVIESGGFQRITAGTGILHDEKNLTENPLRMFQIWFAPRQFDILPDYAVVDSRSLHRTNQFARVINQAGGNGVMSINADASISLGHFEAGYSIDIEISPGRVGMLYLVDGDIQWDGLSLGRQDHLRFHGVSKIHCEIITKARLLLIESAN